jgi:hypothetical protein
LLSRAPQGIDDRVVLYVAMRVGRLFEVRVAGAVTRADVDDHVAKMRAALVSAPDKRVAIVGVHALEVMGPGAADRFLEVMRAANTSLARSAYLLPLNNTTLGLQMWRLLQEAGNPARRSFTDRPALEGWLGEELEPSEKQRLRAFLATPVGSEA